MQNYDEESETTPKTKKVPRYVLGVIPAMFMIVGMFTSFKFVMNELEGIFYNKPLVVKVRHLSEKQVNDLDATCSNLNTQKGLCESYFRDVLDDAKIEKRTTTLKSGKVYELNQKSEVANA